MSNNKIYYRLFLSFVFISVGLFVFINRVEGKTYTLTINNIGNASGEVIIRFEGRGFLPIRVVSFPSKHNIPEKSVVYLRALNAPGSVFVGFTGDCGGGVPYWPYDLPNYCTAYLNKDITVNVNFTKGNIEKPSLCPRTCNPLPPGTPMTCVNTGRVGNPGGCGTGCQSGDLWSRYERKCVVITPPERCEYQWTWEKACALTDKFNYGYAGSGIPAGGICRSGRDDCTVVNSTQQGATSQYSHLLLAGSCDCAATGKVPYKICCKRVQEGNNLVWKPTPNLVAKGTAWSNLDDRRDKHCCY
ncbi:MAG: hypothetical protein DDT40_01718 [candidate division WS2 bacterium]|nr:hypothetical protein [Candidatus Psychracetigena formicireducens]